MSTGIYQRYWETRLGSEPMMGVTLAQELARESLLSIIQVSISERLCSQEYTNVIGRHCQDRHRCSINMGVSNKTTN